MNFDFTKKDICWTTTPYSEDALDQLPYIEMRGYEQTYSAVIESINYWATRTFAQSPYTNLYLGTPRNNYKLPYFNEYHHSTSQGWQETSGPVSDVVKSITDIAEAAGRVRYPAAGILSPKSYEGSTPASYPFTFNLINTYAGNGGYGEIANNVEKNRNFLHQFIQDNLHGQNNALSVTPPLIYEVRIPGVRWSPAAVVSNFVVNNKGTMNKNKNGYITSAPPEYIYPDAWEVTITITELINESKTIWNDAINGGNGTTGLTTRVFGGVNMIVNGEATVENAINVVGGALNVKRETIEASTAAANIRTNQNFNTESITDRYARGMIP